MIELIKTRMRNDHHAAFSQKRLIPVHIEVIAKRHHLHKQRIQCRIDVIRRDIRDARDQNVALAFDRDLVLPVIELEDLVVHRFGLAGIAADLFILSRYRVEHLSTRGTGHF